MSLAVGITIATLVAISVYLMLRRHVVQVALGFAVLSNAVNLLIVSAAGVARSRPPIVPPGEEALAATAADPLPQAFVLTAIVISFGILAFLLVLLLVTFRRTGTDNPDAWVGGEVHGEQPPEPERMEPGADPGATPAAPRHDHQPAGGRA
ncbi:MAG TPA: NADH-quinone oxidoreductase subunit K [Candidatus Thermoplasmatota archaeon]|nr:NADH-quinone oxidoreductase subunit K [Candidatus Thermoplasmatota archaeon]